MKSLKLLLVQILMGVLCILPLFPADAQEPPLSSGAGGISQDEANRNHFTDHEVITHEGEKLRFYSDVLKDRIVLINFFYISCPTAPPGLVRLSKTQELLGDELGKDIFFISISVDAENDNPLAVKEYAAKFNPQKGWIFLTGDKQDMDLINRKLGNRLRLPEGHIQNFVMGNLKTGSWMRMPSTAPPSAIADGLRSLRQQ
jgi:protein SCO1/2